MAVSDRRMPPCVRLAVALGLAAGAWTVVLPVGIAAAEVSPSPDSMDAQLQPAEPGTDPSVVPLSRQNGTTVGSDDDAGEPTPTPDPAPADTSSTPTSGPTTGPAETSTDGAQSVLSLAASMSPSVVTQDEVTTITITVHNDGPGDATAVSVIQTIPEGAVLQSHVKGLDAATGLWQIPELAAGVTATLEFPVMFPEAAGEVVTAPTVVADNPDVDVVGSQESAVVAVLPAVPGGPSNGPSSPSGGGTPGPTVQPSYSGGSGSTSSGDGGQQGGDQNDNGAGASTGPGQSVEHDPATTGGAQPAPNGPSATLPTPTTEGAPDVGRSTATAEPGADEVGASSSRAALVMLGVALLVTGSVLLGIGARRRRQLWG